MNFAKPLGHSLLREGSAFHAPTAWELRELGLWALQGGKG